MSRLDAMKEQYKESTSSKKTVKKENKFNEDNYFATFLSDGVNSAQRQIRIVEPKGINESPFVSIMGHKKQVEGQWRTFICSKHEKGEKCPFCEARELLLAQGDDATKKESVQYSAKKMYVVKVIDREHPEHGVKFWRFNHHYKNAGTWDKINAAFAVLPKTEDPFSSTLGRDMIVSISRDGKNSVVTGINFDMVQTPLSEDATQIEAWKSDDRTWEDVYSVKPYDYNEIIVRGGVPVWKKDASGEGGKWVDKASLTETEKKNTSDDDHDSELTIGSTSNETSAPVNTTPSNVAPSVDSSDEDEDDLPF